LIRQLIERFQRTSITPRQATLATPRWNFGGILGLGVGIGINGPETPHLNDSVYPDCFSNDEFSDFLSSITPSFMSSSNNNLSSSNALDDDMNLFNKDLIQPSSEDYIEIDEDKRRRKFKGVRLSSELISSTSSPFNADDSSIEVAVMVAHQIISKSTNADKLLRMLTSDE
jgi:hypothetical protein